MAKLLVDACTGLRSLQTRRSAERTSRALRLAAREVRNSAAFAYLHPYSLAFASIESDLSSVRSLNLVIPDVRSKSAFAGTRTALEFACALSSDLGLPLRVVTLGTAATRTELAELRPYLRREFGYSLTLEVVAVDQLMGRSFHPNDYWMGTHWTTAHPLDIATRLGTLDPRAVIYFVQDYEPGFSPWSTAFALTRSTYHAGFRMVVNSAPLHRYLAVTENVSIDPSFVFAPSLDLPRLEAAAAQREVSTNPRIFFYGRPSKPRNLFEVGLGALYLVAEQLNVRGIHAGFISAGELHRDIALSPRHTLHAQGKLSWLDYFNMLSRTDVVLALQHSPHPSHPPLDAVTSGAFAVTNEFGDTRATLHPRLLVAEPDPTALAARVMDAIDATLAGNVGSYDPKFIGRLGKALVEVVAVVAESLRHDDRTLARSVQP